MKFQNLNIFTEYNNNENGYIIFSGGLTFQWGKGFTFVKPFKNKCLRVIATYAATSEGNDNSDITVISISTTGYQTKRTKYATYYFAIGY